jgi:aldose 1-epimerase
MTNDGPGQAPAGTKTSTDSMTTSPLSASLPIGQGRLFTLRNDRDMAVTIAERGAALVSWWAPDRYGRLADVLIGSAQDGDGTAGRSSGPRRLDPALWKGAMADGCVSLRLDLPAGAEGGAATVELSYLLDDHGRLTITWQVVADQGGALALGFQPCFNLNGGRGGVDDHMLRIDADHYLKIDHGGIPLGVAAVAGTPFDFRVPAPIGARLTWPDVQLGLAGGFDHCYWVGRGARHQKGTLRQVAQVVDPVSGRRLRVATTDAGLRFFSGGQAGGGCAGFSLAGCAHPEQLGRGQASGLILAPRRVHRRSTVYALALQS